MKNKHVISYWHKIGLTVYLTSIFGIIMTVTCSLIFIQNHPEYSLTGKTVGSIMMALFVFLGVIGSLFFRKQKTGTSVWTNQ